MKGKICLAALIILVATCKKVEQPAQIVPVPATITTTTASAITSTTATSGGEITNDGGAPITQRGICYNTSASPTTAKGKVTGGNGTGSFTANITGLIAGTIYYLRAYAINSAGTAYGNEVSFKTSSVLSAITTAVATAITSTSATSGGNITSDGGATITERGICYDTTVTPTIAKSKVASGSGTGSFTASMTGLVAGTSYYVRAYAINSAGTAYGNEESFKTTSTLATITTTTASAITSTTATSGGEITYDGGAIITERGICYDTTVTPTIAKSKVISGSGIGTFTANITGLTAGTTYYLRAYATNNAGTAYGNEVSFKTISNLASITTIPVYRKSYQPYWYYCGGEITGDGGSNVTERGVCIDLATNPTISKIRIKDINSGTGKFEVPLDYYIDLTKVNYLRAYAINIAGVAYGNEVIYGIDRLVCSGQGWGGASKYNPTKSGTHPIYYYNDSIPKEWQTLETGSAELILCEISKRTTIETCIYSGAKFVSRDRIQLDLTLREAISGNTIATKSFISREPERCPPTTIYGGSIEGKINYAEIRNWLQPYVVK